MADPNGLGDVGKLAAGLAGGGGLALLLGRVLGGLLTGWLSGTTGQERELRDGLSARVEKLEAKVESLEARLDTVTRLRDGWRFACLTARSVAEELARRHGETLAAWEDPKEEP